MKHPTDELIISYLYKEASAEESGAIERHIAECRDCAEKIEGIKNTIFDIDSMDDAAVPEFLESKLADFFEKIAMMDDPKQDSNPKISAGADGVRSGDEIMTPEELAGYLKIPANSIYDMLGEIPHLLLAGRVRFRRSSIDKWLDSREKNAQAKRSAIRDFDDSVKLWRNVI